MTPISQTVAHIADNARAAAQTATASHPVAPLTPVPRPQLSEALRVLAQTVQAGPDRWGTLNKHDPGFRLANQLGVEFHPDAERTAELLRASRERRMEVGDIVEWLEPIAAMVPNAPVAARLRAFAAALAMSECRHFPFVVWEDAFTEALTAFAYWPSGKEVRELLARYDARQLAEIRALKTITRGRTEPPPPPAAPSTEPYNPAAYLTDQRERPQPAPPRLEIGDTPSREKQLMDLGLMGVTATKEGAEAALAARREKFGQ